MWFNLFGFPQARLGYTVIPAPPKIPFEALSLGQTESISEHRNLLKILNYFYLHLYIFFFFRCRLFCRRRYYFICSYYVEMNCCEQKALGGV